MGEQVRVAVIGSTGRGNYGHALDEVWLEIPEATILAVADDNSEGLAAAARRLKIDKGFADYRVMLDEVKPEVVSICPRWIDRHHEIAMACADRGIHMYLEKPFCSTLGQADEIIAACERSHTRLAIACQTRYSPKVKAAKKLIEEGKLGQVLEYRGRGKEDQRGGAEDLWVLGTHVLDLIRYFAGDPSSCFANLTIENRPVEKRDVKPGPEGLGPLAGDAVQAMYSLPNGTTAFFASRKNAGKGDARFGLKIFGSAGVLDVAFGYMASLKFLPDPAWSPARSNKSWVDVSSAGVEQPEPIAIGGIPEGNRVAVTDLLAAIKEQREPLGGMYEARGALEMVHGVFESHRQEKPVALPLANRQHALAMLE